MPVLVDAFGRTATDLRVSLTDRCNLRCSYCMPPEGLDWLPKPEVLTDGEVLRLVGIGVRDLGITEVRYTGGEPLLRYCLEHGYRLRFIEQMPLDAQHGWTRAEMITADEILDRLSAEFTLTPDEAHARGSAPAETFLVDGGPATVGVIGSVTRPFCGACDRVRLTADGQIRNCLFATEESNLRDVLRDGATDTVLADRWRAAVRSKRAGHGIDDPSFLQPARPMSAIGG